MALSRSCVFQVFSLRNALHLSRIFYSNSPKVGEPQSEELFEERSSKFPAPRRRKNFWKVKQQRYHKNITDLVRKSRQDEAVKLLEQMKKGRVRPDEVTYNTILSGYAKQGNIKLAFKTFNEMKKRGLLPTDHTYSSMFSACGAAGVEGAAVLDKVRTEMERRNFRPNTIVTNSLISALALGGRHEESMQVYLDMSKVSSMPDRYTFGGLLLALSKDKSGGLDVAKRVWSEMLASRLELDLYSYNMALQVLRDGGVAREQDGGVCLNVYGEPLKRVIPLVSMDILQKREGGGGKTQLLGEAAKSLGTGQGVTSAHKIAVPTGKQGKMKEKKSEAEEEEKSWNWLVDCAAKDSVFFVKDKVEFSFSETHHVVIHMGSVTPTGPVVTRWLEKPSIEAFFAALKHSSLKPDIHTFHLLVHLTLDPAHLLLTMKERKVAVDNKFMIAAITSRQSSYENLQGAKMLFEYSRQIGLDLGQVGYQAIASGCNHYKDGMNLLRKMKVDQVPPNQHVMGTLIGHAVRDRNYVYLTELVKVMMHLDFKPNPTILAMLDAAAARRVKPSSHQANRLDGFRGFYFIWKRKIEPPPAPEKQEMAASDG